MDHGCCDVGRCNRLGRNVGVIKRLELQSSSFYGGFMGGNQLTVFAWDARAYYAKVH
jgi:hypothetical protein